MKEFDFQSLRPTAHDGQDGRLRVFRPRTRPCVDVDDRLRRLMS